MKSQWHIWCKSWSLPSTTVLHPLSRTYSLAWGEPLIINCLCLPSSSSCKPVYSSEVLCHRWPAKSTVFLGYLYFCSLITSVTSLPFLILFTSGLQTPKLKMEFQWRNCPVSKKTLICVWKKKKISRSPNLSSLGDASERCQCRNQPWTHEVKGERTKVNQTRLKRSTSVLSLSSVLWWDHLRSGTSQKPLVVDVTLGVCEAWLASRT